MFTKHNQLIIRLFSLLMLSGTGVACAMLESETPAPCVTSDSVRTCGDIVEQESKNIQEMLLVLPTNCERHICFWEIDPGQTSYREFKDILLEIYITLYPTYQDDSSSLEGIHDDISFSAGGGRQHTQDDNVKRLDLTVYPNTIYDVEQIAPRSIISTFGVPDDVYVWAFPDDQFGIYLLYHKDAFLYEIRATAQDQKLCLSLDNVKYFSLKRFDEVDTALWYIDFIFSDTDEALSDYFEEDKSVLPGLAESDPFCLTLKP